MFGILGIRKPRGGVVCLNNRELPLGLGNSLREHWLMADGIIAYPGKGEIKQAKDFRDGIVEFVKSKPRLLELVRESKKNGDVPLPISPTWQGRLGDNQTLVLFCGKLRVLHESYDFVLPYAACKRMNKERLGYALMRGMTLDTIRDYCAGKYQS